MRLRHVLVSGLLLRATVEAQTGQSEVSRPLPQWLTGIIAVAVFLFLAFVAMMVKKTWFSHRSRGPSVSECHRESTPGVFRHIKHHENEVVEVKVTAM